MVPQAPLEDTEAGRVAKGDGWFVLNARHSRWHHADGRPALCDLEGDADFSQLGFNICVLGPASRKHVIVGAGGRPCVVVATGVRDRSVDSPDWGGYPVDEVALRHGAGLEQETNEPAPLPRRPALAADACGLWLGARVPEPRPHYLKGH
jgi:hypothetical protein